LSHVLQCPAAASNRFRLQGSHDDQTSRVTGFDPIEASLVLDRAADLTIEGTYLILNAFVLHDPNDPLTKSDGLSLEKNARAK
jgi:hypothetical protein